MGNDSDAFEDVYHRVRYRMDGQPLLTRVRFKASVAVFAVAMRLLPQTAREEATEAAKDVAIDEAMSFVVGDGGEE